MFPRKPLLGALALALLVSSADAGERDICAKTALTVHRAVRHELKEDLLVDLAAALNITDEDDQAEAVEVAWDEYFEGRDEANEVLHARLDLCDVLGPDAYDPEIDPADFVAVIDNPLMPLIPGMLLRYEKQVEDDEQGSVLEEVVVEVLDDTREIAGVSCTVVRDTVRVDGELVEDTHDWFAQDVDGNVWYFGEIAVNYEDGELSDLEGSWEHGEDGAKAGIVMYADADLLPLGTTYRQEWLLDEAEDIGAIEAVDQTVTIGLGSYTGCLQTLDYTPLEPGVFELKAYAPGIGVIQELDLESGELLELVEFSTGD